MSRRGHDIDLIRNTFPCGSRTDWDAISEDLRPVYTAATETAAHARLTESRLPVSCTIKPEMIRGACHVRCGGMRIQCETPLVLATTSGA